MLDFTFSILPILFSLVFLLVFGIILYTVVKSISQSRKNAASPRITAPATLVSKRYSVHTSGTGQNNMAMHHTYNNYYVTFEFESGDRMEFSVPSDIYGLSVEGDHENLCFQGTKFISFERT